MRVLLIKTSSLGDVIHTLPALTDAMRAIPGIRFDWVVEEGFAEIPRWHPAVDRVIPVALRRWRKNLWSTLRGGEWRQFKAPDFELLKKTLKQPLIFDGRNLFDPARMREKGFIYKPNVNVMEEMANMISASRSYDANVQVADAAKQMLSRTLTLGQR